MKRVVIKFRDDPDNRRKWRDLCNKIDDDATYEEVVEMLYTYFTNDEARIATLQRESRPPEFR